ncbi:DUF7010 family protein [Pseudorhodoferax sp.]|uniref:DUF7010 family protein n=1 Tax=Pseudorhodoferax sp. TaxID=1993553 RepID=UPI002DD699EC|nr:hypothetical protein [Pseudorhodoferax sp.]
MAAPAVEAPRDTGLAMLRADFEARANRSMSMPLAGLVVWLATAAAGVLLPFKAALLFMVVATGAIFPLALGVARLRGEALVSNPNPLARLLGMCIFMVNLLWALHIPLLAGQPAYVPLSLGTALGLHWVVYSWIVGHPLGVIHATLRTALVLAAWLALPDHRVTGVALAVATAYAVALLQMQTRSLPSPVRPSSTAAGSP